MYTVPRASGDWMRYLSPGGDPRRTQTRTFGLPRLWNTDRVPLPLLTGGSRV
jgi:hypothetical protein